MAAINGTAASLNPATHREIIREIWRLAPRKRELSLRWFVEADDEGAVTRRAIVDGTEDEWAEIEGMTEDELMAEFSAQEAAATLPDIRLVPPIEGR